MENTTKITRDQFYEFIRKSDDTPESISSSTQEYLAYYDSVQETGKATKFNLFAFLFAPFWLFYRKMYLYGVLLIVFWNSVGLLQHKMLFQLGHEHSIFIAPFALIVHILVGVYGNYLYLHHADKMVAKGVYHKGTSLVAVIIATVIFSGTAGLYITLFGK
jgi:hypothetical protein